MQSLPEPLAAIGARLGARRLLPTSQLVYALTSAYVRMDVGASITVYVLDQQGIPMAGAPVKNVRPDGKEEVIQTAGNGAANFFMGGGSAFSVGQQDGPHTIFVDDANSDVVMSLGLPNGHHCEYVLTFRLMPLSSTPSPTPVKRLSPTLEAIFQELLSIREA